MYTKEKKFKSHIKSNVYFNQKLKELGLTGKYTGFYFLLEILDIVINGEIVVKSFTKQVYPFVAKRFKVKECTIERNIRSLIKNEWTEELGKKLNIDFAKISCCNFVKQIIKYVVKGIS